MPSQRRMRVFTLLIVLVIGATLYMSGSARQTRSSDFYTRTQQELQAREFERAAKLRDEQDVTSRLKAAEAAAKENTNLKDQRFKESVEGTDKTVAGRVKLREQNGDKKQVPGVAGVGGKSRDREGVKEDDETQEEHEVETELNDILKKSPIIIFSKSHCPHSRDAKRILLDKYNIVPAPYVVELDEHPMGAQLQAVLGETTGRRTVPNVLVIGKSIGGGDDMVELHRSDKLIDTLRSMGGARIVEASHRESSRVNLDMRRRRA